MKAPVDLAEVAVAELEVAVAREELGRWVELGCEILDDELGRRVKLGCELLGEELSRSVSKPNRQDLPPELLERLRADPISVK